MERAAAAPGPAGLAVRPRERRADARARLIAHATRIFAAKGYAASSTREICEAAGANVAAIHYHFGDKEGLYRAVLAAPIEAMAARFGRFDDPALDFGQAMRVLLRPFVAMALDEDPEARDVLRLHLREAFEPTDVFRDVVDRIVVPLHRALAALLARHCGLAGPDAGIHQLGFAIVAMASDYCTSREFIRRVAPDLLDDEDAAARIVERLAGYASALLAHEIASRSARGADTSAAKPGRRP
jgi:AcrR family transcriptional regulator